MNPAAVERFIRDTLGCGCPDEVFRDLRLEPADGVHDGAIHVGGRLLVMLLCHGVLAGRLAPLLQAGRQRRDREGYNRLRVVVITRDPEACRAVAEIFDASPLRDERMHFHQVAPEALTGTGILLKGI